MGSIDIIDGRVGGVDIVDSIGSPKGRYIDYRPYLDTYLPLLDLYRYK